MKARNKVQKSGLNSTYIMKRNLVNLSRIWIKSEIWDGESGSEKAQRFAFLRGSRALEFLSSSGISIIV
jgi:hypothetical protein